MRRYSRDVEERVRLLDLVGEWVRSGLVDAGQGKTMSAELSVDLRRTNAFLRAGLALFTALIVAAFVGLVAVEFELRGRVDIGMLTAVSAAACIAAAELMTGRYRLYRFGIEEALAVAAVVLLCISEDQLWPSSTRAVTLFIGAAGALGVFLRYGFIYAAVGGTACLALIPFQLALPASAQRSAAAVIAAVVTAAARAGRLKHGDDYPGDEFGDLQVLGLAGVYVALNVQIFPLPEVAGVFYWFTYAMTWILPAAGLFLGLRDRDRILIDIGAVMALVTLVTSKPYLGWARNTWDPIVLGVVLIAGAIALRRWLEQGTGRERYGFTATRIFESDRQSRAKLGLASVMLPAPPSAPATPPSEFGGARSGGGGGGDSF